MSSPTLTSLESDGWSLHDGEAAHAQSPATYWIPASADRRSLRSGDLAKLRFCIRAPNEFGTVVEYDERMWVQVKRCVGDWYHGELDNDPYCGNRIRSGLELWFQARHIIGIDRNEAREGAP